MIRQCCECKRIWVKGTWVYPRLYQLEGQDISHGYCEECFQKTIDAIHAQHHTPPAGWRRMWRGVKRLIHQP